MTQLHRAERHTRCWPEDRAKYSGAQRRFGREVVRAEVEAVERDVDANEPPFCETCGGPCTGDA